jgi:hypothetical protein
VRPCVSWASLREKLSTSIPQISNYTKRTQQLTNSKRTPQKNEPGKTHEIPRKTQDFPVSTQAEPGVRALNWSIPC